MTKANKIAEILSTGTVLRPLSWHKSREKVSGAMYEARAHVEYAGMQLYFEMWHHHNSNEDMTIDEVLEKLDLKGLKIGDRYYDLCWYSRRCEGRFMLHPTGWFGGDHDLADEVYSARTCAKLEQLGLKHIPELDWGIDETAN